MPSPTVHATATSNYNLYLNSTQVVEKNTSYLINSKTPVSSFPPTPVWFNDDTSIYAGICIYRLNTLWFSGTMTLDAG